MDDKNQLERLFVIGSEERKLKEEDAMDPERWRKKIKMPDPSISCS